MISIVDDSSLGRAESDFVDIIQVSAVGSLADAVLRELDSLRADVRDIDLTGIPVAIKVFRGASENSERERDIWEAPTDADRLLRFAFESQSTVEPRPRTDTPAAIRFLLGSVADDLERSLTVPLPEEKFGEIRGLFEKIAAETLRSIEDRDSSRYSVL